MAVIVRAVLIALGLIVLHVAPGSASDGARLPFGAAPERSFDVSSGPAALPGPHDALTDAGEELEPCQAPEFVHTTAAPDPVAGAATLGSQDSLDHDWLTVRQHRPPKAA